MRTRMSVAKSAAPQAEARTRAGPGSRTAPPRPVIARPAGRCACGGGCPRCQAKLTIGPVNDPLEREADLLASLVTRQDSAGTPPVTTGSVNCPLQRACACSGSCGCSTHDEDDLLQKKATSASDTGSVPRTVDSVLASPGEPLPGSIRHTLESRFGRDFGNVRIHADPQAAQSANDVQALAYTVGRDIVFGVGQFAPTTPTGQHLLAHELAHVIQQGAAGGQVVRRTPAGIIQRQTVPEHRPLPQNRAILSEKWSENVEVTYRRAGRADLADAVRNCREWGDCGRLLTISEARLAYTTGRIQQNLGPPPEPELRQNPGSTYAVAGAALLLAQQAERTAVPAALNAAQRTLIGGTAVAANTNAVATGATAAVATGGTETATVAAGGTVAAGATIAVVAGAVLITGLMIYDLFSWGQFEAKLRSMNYIVLPSPLGCAIGACHTAPAVPAQPRIPLDDRFPQRDPHLPFDPDLLQDLLQKTKPAPDPKPKQTPTPTTSPIPSPDPKKKRKRRPCGFEPCGVPLPISWPIVLPLPRNWTKRGLIRRHSGDLAWEGVYRGEPQSTFSRHIKDWQAGREHPPKSCFNDILEEFDRYDAHHVQPLFLNGTDSEENLCALQVDRHAMGHPLLQYQYEHLAEYEECGICTADLYKHPEGQEYVIVGRK